MKENTIKDINGQIEIGLFIGYMVRRLEYSKFKSKKGVSKKLGGLISQYKSHLKSNPVEDFLNFKEKSLKNNVPEKEDNGYIYFIGNREQKIVKIGFSKKPNKRLKQLQTSNPYKLKLLYKVRGNRADEEEFHNKFKQEGLEGEWFSLTGELLRYLMEIGVKF